MKKAFDLCENALNVLGVGIAITDINNVINLILLVVSVLAILVRGAFQIYDHIKGKEYGKVKDDLQEALDDIKETTDNIKEGK